MSDFPLVSLADLESAGVRLRPVEAVTIVHQVVLQVSNGDLPGVPSAHVIRLAGDGTVSVEGPVAAGGRAVSRAAQLLESMLPGFDAPPELRVPGALRLVVGRALGVLDLPKYPSIEDFAEGLARFIAPDPAAAISEVVAGFARALELSGQAAAAEPAPPASGAHEMAAVTRLDTKRAEPADPLLVDADSSLTISDIRRARRATGLTLTDIAERSRIPAWLLRELEWGYFRNWPGGHYGRTQLMRYARASGLDDQVVVRTVWPMLEEEARQHGAALVPAVWAGDEVIEGVIEEDETAPMGTAVALAAPAFDAGRPEVSRRTRVLAALAIPALLALALVPAVWQRAAETQTAAEPQVVARAATAPDAPAIETASRPAAAPPEAGRGPAAPPTAAAIPPRGSISNEPAATTSAPLATRAADPGPERLLPDAAVYSPSFASAGSAMFYHADSGSDSKLMRADTDSGGAILRVTSVVDDDARNFHARPSPDGERIAFDSDREGERAVYTADADGQNVRRVSGPGFAAIPSWSPDGRTLAYVRAEPDRPTVWNLWLQELGSGEERRLTSFRVGQPWGASWFPDGRRIAFSHETRLIIKDLSTGRERVYPSPIKGRLVRTPAVSPDGSRILFQVRRDGAWLLDVADGSMRRVLSDPSAEEYTWAPDGRRVAYHSRQSGTWGVWVMASR
jgi:hypothetical protein